jgi:hypothetical protein
MTETPDPPAPLLPHPLLAHPASDRLRVALLLDPRPQWRIAHKARINSSTLSLFAHRKRQPSEKQQARIAKVLGIEASILFPAPDPLESA